MSEVADLCAVSSHYGSSQAPTHGAALQPQRVAIQSQHLEELPNRFKGGQYMLDQSN